MKMIYGVMFWLVGGDHKGFLQSSVVLVGLIIVCALPCCLPDVLYVTPDHCLLNKPLPSLIQHFRNSSSVWACIHMLWILWYLFISCTCGLPPPPHFVYLIVCHQRSVSQSVLYAYYSGSISVHFQTKFESFCDSASLARQIAACVVQHYIWRRGWDLRWISRYHGC